MSTKSLANEITNRAAAGVPLATDQLIFSPLPNVPLVTQAKSCTVADLLPGLGLAIPLSEVVVGTGAGVTSFNSFLYADRRLLVTSPTSGTGADVIINGTFTGSAAGWTLGDAVVYSGNSVTADQTVGTGVMTVETAVPVVVVSGVSYLLQFTITGTVGTGLYVYGDNFFEGPYANGTHKLLIQEIANVDTIGFADWDDAAGDKWTLDSVSMVPYVAETSPLQATLATGKNSIILLDGLHNTAFGNDALGSNIVGGYCTAVGFDALKFSNADENTAVGVLAGLLTTTGHQNTAVGASALIGNSTGHQNVAVGANALYGSSTGNGNTAVGVSALFDNTTGAVNTGLGANAMRHVVGGVRNTATGYNAGGAANNGSDNIFIGANSGPTAAVAVNNQLFIHASDPGAALPLIGGDFALHFVTIDGELRVSRDIGGAASTTTLTNGTNTTLTNAYLVKGGQALNTANTGWLKLYVGTNAVWVPYWQNATP